MGIPQQILHKIKSLDEAIVIIDQWKELGEQIVFTNGVFDIQHPGHVTYLDQAKQEGTRLVIGLNSDASVRRLNKGDDRPINGELSRGVMLAGLYSTDLVVVFDEDTPLEIIKKFLPDVLVKGGDYSESAVKGDTDYIVGSEEVRAGGGIVKSIPFLEGYSSTKIINKIRGEES